MPQPRIDSVVVRNVKFSNGEISPTMYADVTHPKWTSSLRTCKNWLPIPQGALVTRPGTKFVATTRNNDVSRLIPFVFSDLIAFMFEVSSDQILRVYKNGSLFCAEIGTPWTAAMLPYLKFAQVGNIVTVTYGGQAAAAASIPPYDIAYTSGAFVPFSITQTPLRIPINTTPAAISVSVGAWDPSTSYRQGDMVADGHILWTSTTDSNRGNKTPANPGPPTQNSALTGFAGNLFWTPSVDATHPGISVEWLATFTAQDPSGVTYESLPSPVTSGVGPLSLDRKVPLSFNGLTAPLPAGWTGLFMSLFRGPAGGLHGWLCDYPFSTAPFTVEDQGTTPDYTHQPPSGTNPFSAGANLSFPAVVGYLDQRRMFGGSPLLPQALWLSKNGDFVNWDRPTPGADTDSILMTVAAEKLEQPRSFMPMRRGVLLTGQSEWVLSGPNGVAISRTGKELKWQSGWGSNWLNPLRIGTGLLFNTSKSNMVRDFYPLYGIYSDIWDGQELSFMARHLFDLFTVTDWAFQSVPYPVAWVVRSDGTLLSLTYQHAPPSFGQQIAEGVVAWATHTTGGAQTDAFEAVCVVPEPPEDAVYVIVRRTVGGVTKRYIERMNNPVSPAAPSAPGVSDPRYALYLDSALTYDGHANTNDPSNFLSINSVLNPGSTNPADYTSGAQVTISIAGAASFAASDAGASSVVCDPENVFGLTSFDVKINTYVSPIVALGELQRALTAADLAKWASGIGAAQTRWGLKKSSITLAHLTGYDIDTLDVNLARGINALGDADVDPIVSFVGGVLTVANPALVLTAGLSYNCDVELLDAHHPNQDIRNIFKKLTRIGFEVNGTRGVWGGASLTNLWEFDQRNLVDAYGLVPLASGYYEAEVTDSWSKDGRGALRHIDPLPATLMSALREFVTGGS